MRWLGSIPDSRGMNLSKFREIVNDREPGMQGVARSQTGLSDWTT